MKKKLLNKLSTAALSGIAVLALVVTTTVTNAACLWYFGQEEMPKNSRKLRRF